MESLDEIRRTWAAQQHRMAAQLNQISLDDFMGAAENWRANYAKWPKPVSPTAIEVRISFEPTWKAEFIDTGKPLTPFDPASLLPKFATDTNAVGGPVGGPIADEHGKPTRKFHCASGDAFHPGMQWKLPDGSRTFVKISEGFAGMSRYWLEIT